MRQRRLGTLYVFIAAVLYSIGGLCIKIIPWNGMSINSARNIVALMVVGGYLLISRHRPRFNRWIALGMVSVCGTKCAVFPGEQADYCGQYHCTAVHRADICDSSGYPVLEEAAGEAGYHGMCAGPAGRDMLFLWRAWRRAECWAMCWR